MSAELYLQRFDPSGDDGPRRPGILVDLASVARRILDNAGTADDADVQIADGQILTINLDGGAVEMHATHGSIPRAALDKTGIQLAFELAKEGDMVIVIEGGKYRAILTDPRQWDALPADWIEDQAQAPVCHSAAELKTLLGDWFGVHRRYADQMRRELDKRAAQTSPGPIPGTRRDAQNEFIYIQASPESTALQHLKLVEKWYRAAVKAGSGALPKCGLMGGSTWQLKLPTGEVFYALSVSGDKDAWLLTLRECASSAGRAVGRIVNGDKFVLDDGLSFPLSACTCTKVKE
jgi:hypothetical protein